MTPSTWLPFRNCFQHRALVPSYLVICAGATSLCAEGKEGWQAKAPLPLGALISSFRPRSFTCALQIPPVASPLSLSGEGGPSALPRPPFSLTAQQLYLLPCPKEQRRCCVESPVPRWSQAGGGMTGLQHMQHIRAGSLRPARPLAVLSYRGGTRGLAVPLQIAAHCCWHSCKSWVGTAIPDATGEGKRRIIMAISHCRSLKSVSLGDGIFPR